MAATSISFIIPAYNCQDTIAETVDSIYDNNFLEGDEVIIINDASTDDTLAVIANLLEKYPSIYLLHHKINKGTAAAGRNTGIEHSKNELLFCLDADNVLAQGSIQKLKTYMLANNADAVAFGEIHYFKEKEKEKVKFKWVLNPIITFIDNINLVDKTPCSSGNYMFTKKSWVKAGRCNEFVGGAWDSWAFGAAQLATGTKMITLPDSYYYHRYGYESTYFREIKNMNISVSLKILQIILPHLHLVHERDAAYIMGKQKYTWFDKIKNRPVRGNNDINNGNYKLENNKHKHISQAPLLKRIVRAIINEIKK